MSRLQVGRLTLQCSMNILKAALKNILVDKNIDQIRYSDSGDLNIQTVNMDDRPGTFNIVIPREIGLSNSDIGFQKQSDGTWKVKGDRDVYGLTSAITQEVFAMRAKAVAEIKNLEMIKDELEGTDRVIRIRQKITN